MTLQSLFAITSTIKSFPSFPYEKMKDEILGKKYQLSLSFIGKKRAASINTTTRQKTYSPNVLSFPLDTNVGEIFICPEAAYPEAAKFSLSREGYIAYLFIHGLLHLKGHDHGDTMDKLEQRYLKRFAIK
jgi:probable rRNA maturation factor